MAIALTTIPGWLWTKNPCIVELTGGASELQSAKIAIYNDTELLSESFWVANSDYLKADISGYVDKAFDLIPNDRTGVTLYRESETYLNLRIIVYVNSVNTLLYDATHTFICGGKDVRDSFTIDDFVMVAGGTTFPDFLTEFERLTIWAGQPYDIRFTADAGEDITFGLLCYDRDNNQTLIELDIPGQDYRNVLKVDPTALSAAIPSDTVWIAISITGETDQIGFILADYVTPDCTDGVFLRWLNRVGGVHLWYFRKRDTRRPVKKTTVPQPEAIDYTNNWNRGIAKVVDVEKQTNITVGAEHVKISDYDVIAGIAQSERVDMYMGSGKWMQVIVSDADFNTAHDNDYQDIEFTIITV